MGRKRTNRFTLHVEFVTKKGAWITIGEEFKELVADVAQDLPEKVQGEANLFKMVEENEALSKFLINYFKSNIGECLSTTQ